MTKQEFYMTKQEAIEFFGNASKLALALGISKSAVAQWGEKIPLLRAYELERITNGKLQNTAGLNTYKQANTAGLNTYKQAS